MKKQVKARLWLSILWQFRKETSGFKIELSNLTDRELYPGIKLVSSDFLEIAPRMFTVVKPKHHADLRRAIAYLAELQWRQECSMQDQLSAFEKRSTEQRAVMKILQTAGMTNLEKINLVKEYYGWE